MEFVLANVLVEGPADERAVSDGTTTPPVHLCRDSRGAVCSWYAEGVVESWDFISPAQQPDTGSCNRQSG